MTALQVHLLLFTLCWIVAIYAFHSVAARHFKKIVWPRALVYISTVAMLGLYGEVFVDTIYKMMFGMPLWRYNIAPIHHAYTSTFAVVLWGAYGFYLYLLHDNLKDWAKGKELRLVLLFSVEALIIESLVEITSKIILGQYIYYYYPNGLWHISAFQNFPFYFICGALILVTIKRFQSSPRFFIFLNLWLITMMIWIV